MYDDSDDSHNNDNHCNDCNDNEGDGNHDSDHVNEGNAIYSKDYADYSNDNISDRNATVLITVMTVMTMIMKVVPIIVLPITEMTMLVMPITVMTITVTPITLMTMAMSFMPITASRGNANEGNDNGSCCKAKYSEDTNYCNANNGSYHSQ